MLTRGPLISCEICVLAPPPPQELCVFVINLQPEELLA